MCWFINFLLGGSSHSVSGLVLTLDIYVDDVNPPLKNPIFRNHQGQRSPTISRWTWLVHHQVLYDIPDDLWTISPWHPWGIHEGSVRDRMPWSRLCHANMTIPPRSPIFMLAYVYYIYNIYHAYGSVMGDIQNSKIFIPRSPYSNLWKQFLETMPFQTMPKGSSLVVPLPK